MRQAKGFTLTELLIAIAILGILASLAIPRLFPQTERARVSEEINILSAIRQGEEAFRLDNGVYLALPATATNADWNRIGMDNPNPPTARYATFVVTVGAPATTFTATATRNGVDDAGGNVGRTITLNQAGIWGGTHPFVPRNPS